VLTYDHERGYHRENLTSFNTILLDWTDDEIQAQIDFKEPSDVSIGQEPDQIMMIVKDESVFVQKDDPTNALDLSKHNSEEIALYEIPQ
jgi:hypothetical protein